MESNSYRDKTKLVKESIPLVRLHKLIYIRCVKRRYNHVLTCIILCNLI